MMAARTALEIASSLDCAACSAFLKLEAAAMLRQQHTEIERLRADIASEIEVERLRIAALVESYKATPGLAGWDAWPQQIGMVIRASNPEIE